MAQRAHHDALRPRLDPIRGVPGRLLGRLLAQLWAAGGGGSTVVAAGGFTQAGQ